MSDNASSRPIPTWRKKLSRLLLGDLKSREQLVEILREAQERHLLDADSLRMIEGVIQVSEMNVREIMLPRAEMVVVSKDATFKEILPIAIQSGHSRFPVIGDNKDEVIGILLAKDLLSFFAEKEELFSLKDILRPAVFVPESKRLGVLLNEFRKKRNHIALVVDEYGGVSGMVTIEDVIEQIVGEIEDEHDIEEDIFIRKHKDNYYSIKAITPIEEFNHFFATQLKDDEFDTVGGLVMKAFGHLPKRGETTQVEGIPFKVMRANSRRIQMLQTTLTPPAKRGSDTK